MANLWPFLHTVFSASHVQHVSHLRSKFALKPHHVRRLRLGEEKEEEEEEEEEEETTGRKYNIRICYAGRL